MLLLQARALRLQLHLLRGARPAPQPSAEVSSQQSSLEWEARLPSGKPMSMGTPGNVWTTPLDSSDLEEGRRAEALRKSCGLSLRATLRPLRAMEPGG